ncbi:sulfurtransferase TusA family protein [Pseudemcibacter aquimaris]|uniref:sulfurtransferase TusA family protein n=1 Tax=Pseudemcibacter aquimaris TaxID=2857064 RepID=UPI002012E890|nr:sulfurtransferase TusA family protein [Pseudemcibacter aquimaris]MCC3862134.1 sulfurtransferase TusA family protein [Pseudemcibacter aquimaris]WDU58887.1 sulfurtransferase TusA family protein [Pseudemcibacter aquimaris]
MTSVAQEILDVSGHKCPIPVLRLRRALEKLASDTIIELVATDPMTLIDVPHFCDQAGHDIIEQIETEEFIRYLIKKC